MSKEIETTGSNKLIKFSKNDYELIKKQFFPQNANIQDIDYCMGVAENLGLNPITKEIWFVERKANINGQWVTKVEPMAGRDSYIKIAHRSGKFGGLDTTCEVKETPYLNKGSWETKKDLVATCKVYKVGIDKPFIAEVNYSEYVQLTKQGDPTKFWKDKPQTMIKKVAESQALRKAFNITSVFDEAEMRDTETKTTIEEAEIIEEEKQEQIDHNIDMKSLKSKLAKMLGEKSFNNADMKEFYGLFITKDEDLENMVNNEELFNNKVSEFESIYGGEK